MNQYYFEEERDIVTYVKFDNDKDKRQRLTLTKIS